MGVALERALSIRCWGQKVSCSGWRSGGGKDVHREHGGFLKRSLEAKDNLGPGWQLKNVEG